MNRSRRILSVACVMCLVALALMVWSILAPSPLSVMVMMSVGQGLGTLALLLRRERVETSCQNVCHQAFNRLCHNGDPVGAGTCAAKWSAFYFRAANQIFGMLYIRVQNHAETRIRPG